MSPRAALLPLLLLAPLLAGCRSSPDEPENDDGHALSWLLAEAPDWDRVGAKPAWVSSGSKVVVAELGVEFVEEKWMLPGPISWNPLLYTPFPQILGLSVNSALFPQELLDALPGAVARGLDRELAGRQLVVTPMPRAASALSRLKRADCLRVQLLPFADQPFKDAGLTRRVTAVAAPDLLLFDDEPEAVRAACRRLLEETGADVVLRVRLRVGLVEDRAVIECGSHVDWLGRGGEGSLVAVRSLRGEREVVAESGFMPVRGFQAMVAPGPFGEEVELLLPRCVERALEAAGR